MTPNMALQRTPQSVRLLLTQKLRVCGDLVVMAVMPHYYLGHQVRGRIRPGAGVRSGLLVAVALLLVSLGPALAEDPEPPMTEEEVVRRYVTGERVENIVRDIEGRDPQFDLSDEMLEELRHAGLPETLIEAMQKRQAELEPEEPEPSEEQAAPAVPQLTVTLSQKNGGASKISIGKY